MSTCNFKKSKLDFESFFETVKIADDHARNSLKSWLVENGFTHTSALLAMNMELLHMIPNLSRENMAHIIVAVGDLKEGK